MKVINSNCDKKKEKKNLKTRIVIKTKKNQNVTKLKNSNCDKPKL